MISVSEPDPENLRFRLSPVCGSNDGASFGPPDFGAIDTLVVANASIPSVTEANWYDSKLTDTPTI